MRLSGDMKGMFRLCHFSRDCPRGSVPMCFHYNQVGHRKVNYLRLIGGKVNAPAPVTLRIIDDCEGMAEASTMRNRALQLQAREARVSLNAIVGMLSFFSSCFIVCIYVLLNHVFVCVKHYLQFSFSIIVWLVVPRIIIFLCICRKL